MIIETMLVECGIVAIIFGLMPVLNKYILEFIQVDSFIVLSGLIFFAMVVGYLLFFGARPMLADIVALNQNLVVWGALGVTAILTFLVANYFYLGAIRDHKTYLVTAIVASYPMITALFGYLFLGEAMTVGHLVGIGAIVFGIVMLNGAAF